MDDQKKPPADPKATPPGGKPSAIRGQFLSHGQITDSSGQPQTPQGGIALKAGQIDLTGVIINSLQGVGAMLISDDETVVQGAMVTNTTGSGATGLEAPVTWDFRWDAAPAFGLGVLRLIEMTLDPSGAEQTFAVTIVEDPNTDPVAIGNPGP